MFFSQPFQIGFNHISVDNCIIRKAKMQGLFLIVHKEKIIHVNLSKKGFEQGKMA
jgi:hypothetical protein